MQTIFAIIFYSIGVGLCFIPFALFEYRHNFLQTHAIIKTIVSAVYYHSAVVGQVGLSKWGIIKQFGIVLEEILHLSDVLLILLLIACSGYGLWYWKNHWKTIKQVDLTSQI